MITKMASKMVGFGMMCSPAGIRWLLFVKRIFSLKFLFFFIALCLGSCSGKELCKINQIKRSASPDKKVDLIWIQKDCGATVAIAEQIYIAESGVELADLVDASPVFIADRASGLDMFWQRDKILVITFNNARIFQFKNFWHSRYVDSFQYVVNISLEEQKY